MDNKFKYNAQYCDKNKHQATQHKFNYSCFSAVQIIGLDGYMDKMEEHVY